MSRDVARLLRDRRVNALAAWCIVAMLAAVSVTSAVQADLLWAGFAAAVAALALFPPVLLRNRDAMLPWEILLLAASPVVGRLFATLSMTGNLATYLSVAAIALILAVELQLFTPVRMTPRFAVVFVAITTMATAGVWAVVRWVADQFLGTTFILDPTVSEHVIEEAVMWEFVASTIAGIGAGVVFAYYVRRQAGISRVPEEVQSDV
ncbi:hypothetical protein BVU17_04985 [Haloarcula taiwanensis]|uniref:Uncharacterized protein n=1 Tax=Haloarcula taiwanensis TaxID=1932004 RepID=A0A2H4ZWQ0_9EURY|nr:MULTISPECIES: hypothetical protein [Haloarcula]AUG46906.1 hypothetical protein BVU17_04985 [Haloarcula taiwanensis]RLM37110.1 hypothetical protein DVK01_10945 [Haloarcula sp. Atlit-120R]RLM44500.1 hypothetical protein DVK00_08520 [Haloarcula sp. Atlit-47R]RLN01383.1 hypothetical protein D3D01_00775 [Haloarcula sp. Atlit-7R]